MSEEAKRFYDKWITEKFGLTDKGVPYRGALSEKTQSELMQAYADEGKKGFKYCPYCGTKLQHKVETDANAPLECKFYLCKLTLNK